MSYHNKMMNIQFGCAQDCDYKSFVLGHQEARHAAAEIALEADAQIELLERQLSEALNPLSSSVGPCIRFDKEGYLCYRINGRFVRSRDIAGKLGQLEALQTAYEVLGGGFEKQKQQLSVAKEALDVALNHFDGGDNSYDQEEVAEAEARSREVIENAIVVLEGVKP